MEKNKLIIEVSAGEFLDKISILEIKAERIRDREKLHNISLELNHLLDVMNKELQLSERAQALFQDLKSVNEKLWNIEDAIRSCEEKKSFGPAFIQLARSVYQENDLRALLKRELNILLGSSLMEEKSYSKYSLNA